jgi:hypothetical protein
MSLKHQEVDLTTAPHAHYQKVRQATSSMKPLPKAFVSETGKADLIHLMHLESFRHALSLMFIV